MKKMLQVYYRMLIAFFIPESNQPSIYIWSTDPDRSDWECRLLRHPLAVDFIYQNIKKYQSYLEKFREIDVHERIWQTARFREEEER